MNIIALLENPIVLGALVFLITWLIRKVGWKIDGVPALWLVMGVAGVIALLEWLLLGGPSKILICELSLQGPVALLTCVGRILEAVAKEFGVIFAAAQGVYQLLRREIAGRSILGERI